MKVYTNKSVGMKSVCFKDGSAVFIRRGQKYTADESTVVRVDEGIVITDAPETSKKTSTSGK